MIDPIVLRKQKNILFKSVVYGFAGLSVVPLLAILGFLFVQGVSALRWDFLFKLPAPLGETGGGIANALVGTLFLITVASLIAIPLGILAGIFLVEYRKHKIASLARICVDILQGVPSIVLGLIAYIWIVKPMKTFSGFAGAVALSLMMLPVIVRTTEETLKLIPQSLKEASLALGVPYSRTILKVVLPSATSGIVTGVLLAVARIAGETAPLLFTAFGSPYLVTDLRQPIESLPHVIYNYATSPYTEWHTLAWGASFLLVILVLALNFLAKVVTRKWKVQF